MKKTSIVLFIIIAITTLYAQTDITYEYNPIVVTADRFPSEFSDITRNVTILSREQLDILPVISVQDALAYIGGVDYTKRGANGVQAEAALRGGTFEETLILLNGVKINDPQTAHHNLDLPVALKDVERIEVLHGHGAGLYGADALAGVINIITREKTSSSVNLYGGEYGLAGGQVVLGNNRKNMNSSLSIQSSRADGFMHNTGFEQVNVWGQSGFTVAGTKIHINAGYNDKDFGANSYYSTAFPDEKEHTKTYLGVTRIYHQYKNLAIQPQISFKKHADDFQLDYNRPGWFSNQHNSYTTIVNLPVNINTLRGQYALGVKYENERIKSSNLGDHARDTGGFYFSYKNTFKRNLIVNFTAHAQYYEKWGWKYWPGMDAAFKLNHYLKLIVSAGSSYRMPSFTDLYYTSPANRGNPRLTFSKSVSTEAGLAWNHKRILTSISIFNRDGKNVIDWARQNSQAPWQVLNVASLNTRGVEMLARLDAGSSTFLRYVQVDASWTGSNKQTPGFESKYALNYLKYHLKVNLVYNLPLGMLGSMNSSYKKRINRSAYIVTDMSFSKKFGRQEIYLKAANVFDQTYTEIVGVPLPGRWVTAGIESVF